ncbi:sugar phosphate isomerase/epimerase family protein [Microcella sp.]|uniref:sugar phosphate isomerase/epimerase family protein n=1 Tax=Microcella sp. TaxID=1913979 RepID=UPI00391ADAF3
MPRPPVSVQLYTVRDALAADAGGTLQRLAELGFHCVEPFGLTEAADTLQPALAAAGLTAPTSHATLLGGAHAAAFAAAARVGVATVIDPYVPDERWTSRDDVTALAAELTEVARAAADHGLQVGYHNHWWELESRIDGSPALEVFADALGDGVVLELDTYWSAVGGVDPVALLGRLGERVVALHIKDGPVNREIDQQLPAGSGAMPIAEILAAAPHARPVIEFDAYGADLFDGIAESLAFVRTLGVEA